MDRWDAVSPLDYRYYGGNEAVYRNVHPYLSEKATIVYCLKVEAALARGLARRGVCSNEVADEIERACREVRWEEVDQWDQRIHHYTRAIVNSLRDRVSDEAKRFVHLGATSADVMDTSMALRVRDFCRNVAVPGVLQVEANLIDLALSHAETIQIGRTHGQHAVPITFGYAMAGYVDRLGGRIQAMGRALDGLKGVLSGAVGAYNGLGLLVDDPEELEREVLGELGLEPGRHSTQIAQPEPMADLVYATLSCWGVLANLADDLRHLQRPEIGEVREPFGRAQVGSSTMPHKRNPWNAEHVKSMWKEFMPRIITVMADQISEHQRDLTNSATQRFLPEIFLGFYDTVERMAGITEGLEVDTERMGYNFSLTSAQVVAEPLYILLSLQGLSDAHEHVRELSRTARESGRSLLELASEDETVAPLLQRLSKDQMQILQDPRRYVGASVRRVRMICDYWKKVFVMQNDE
jgi:adenylosuccinate lyase